MGQIGHTTPNLTLAIYARQMNRRDGEPERLRALVNGIPFERAAGPRPNASRKADVNHGTSAAYARSEREAASA